MRQSPAPCSHGPRAFSLCFALLVCIVAPAPAAHGSEVYFSPDGGIRQRLVQAIGDSRRTIDLAIYNLTAFELVEALQAAQARGVQIRILMDRENLETWNVTIGRLRRSGIPVRATVAAGGTMRRSDVARPAGACGRSTPTSNRVQCQSSESRAVHSFSRIDANDRSATWRVSRSGWVSERCRRAWTALGAARATGGPTRPSAQMTPRSIAPH